MATLDAHANAKDTDTDTDASKSDTAVANIEEKPLSSPPSGEDVAGPTSTEDDPVRTLHGIKVCPTSAEPLAGPSATLTDRLPIPVVLCLQRHCLERPVLFP